MTVAGGDAADERESERVCVHSLGHIGLPTAAVLAEAGYDVADATQDSTETMQEPCPAEDCDSDRAHYEMIPKPGGSYEVRLFTCVECGHKWRES
ncbi:hypothetical protein [Halobaculum gomorrense]|uniref:DNA-directed RNA polymerase subunit M n=1 Tax=Halobaculum gomorrense TaxID=43928 RepID=A0A1M5UNG3_9EURY|nr:hypothetical protein [Halobaculum gomorrense]SHH64416.1 hypothetical protein SAMN05443636_3082 [Halobaculum gomorrense]